MDDILAKGKEETKRRAPSVTGGNVAAVFGVLQKEVAQVPHFFVVFLAFEIFPGFACFGALKMQFGKAFALVLHQLFPGAPFESRSNFLPVVVTLFAFFVKFPLTFVHGRFAHRCGNQRT